MSNDPKSPLHRERDEAVDSLLPVRPNEPRPPETVEVPSFAAWRSRAQATAMRGTYNAGLKFDDMQKARFLEALARTGRISHAATLAGVNVTTIRSHRDRDEDFSLACDEAISFYADQVQAAVYEQGVSGVKEPVFGGRFKDQVVGYTRKFTPGILAMEAKRVNPAYREKQQIDMNVRGGVLHVPAAEVSADEWQKKFAEAEEAHVIEATAAADSGNSTPDED